MTNSACGISLNLLLLFLFLLKTTIWLLLKRWSSGVTLVCWRVCLTQATMTPISISINRKVPTVRFLSLSSVALTADGSLQDQLLTAGAVCLSGSWCDCLLGLFRIDREFWGYSLYPHLIEVYDFSLYFFLKNTWLCMQCMEVLFDLFIKFILLYFASIQFVVIEV